MSYLVVDDTKYLEQHSTREKVVEKEDKPVIPSRFSSAPLTGQEIRDPCCTRLGRYPSCTEGG